MSHVRFTKGKSLEQVARGEIKKRLSRFSIVEDYINDIGLDFWCQLREGERPSLKYFNVQVKGTEKSHVQWGESIKK